MNVAFAAGATPAAAPTAAPTMSIVTASYAPDFERCRLLCESLDTHVSGFSEHLILVEHSDVALFRQLQSGRRRVVDERELLPSWLHSFRDPLSRFRRRIWLSLRTKPLRGWHVQQLRRIAIAAHLDVDGLAYCDSDVVVLRDFDCSRFWQDGRLRLFRRDDALADPQKVDQREWSRNAGSTLGLTGDSPHDYIATMIPWRRDAALAMCRRIEEVNGMHWVEAIGSTRRFSECMIYGRHADEVLAGEGHLRTDLELCRVYWQGPKMTDDDIRSFVASLAQGQVAIGLQSFIGTDIERIRAIVGR